MARSSRPRMARTTTRAASGTRSTTGGRRSSSSRGRARRSRRRSGSPASTTSPWRSAPAATARRATRPATAAWSIDLSQMRGVTVDPTTRTARANGGAFLGELDVAAQAHGLVCPVGVIGHTGVAGLTLGGGRRSAPAPVRADHRQPAGRRARDRRRPLRPRQRDRGARALLGHARRGLELRDRHGVRVRPAPVRAGPPPRRARLSGDRRARGVGRLRGLRGHRARTPSR